MTRLGYLLRSMRRHWRWLAPVAAAAAVAAGVLAGSLLVGSGVRESLARLAEKRVGRAEYVLRSGLFFDERLEAAFGPGVRACQVIVLRATVKVARTGRSKEVEVYGVDGGFARFHGLGEGAAPKEGAAAPAALARELGARAGDELELLYEAQSDIAAQSPLGRPRRNARTMRMRLEEAGGAAPFSLRMEQGAENTLLAPLARLQREMGMEGRVNGLLLGGASGEQLARRLRERFRLEMAGYRLRPSGHAGEVVLEHASTLLDDRMGEMAVEAGRSTGVLTRASLVGLADRIAAPHGRVSYSFVAAVDEAVLAEVNDDKPLLATDVPPVILNEWAAARLAARPGDMIEIGAYAPDGTGRFRDVAAKFELAGITPIAGFAAERDLAPRLPGITDKRSMAGWEAPFRIDPRRIATADEQYWRTYGATPKAWIGLEAGRKLFGSRHGSYTSVRFLEDDPRIRAVLTRELDPLEGGFTLVALKRESEAAAEGSVDFGDSFVSFGLVLVLAALVNLGLFFRLGVEARAAEIGALRRLGVTAGQVKGMLLAEGLAAAAAGVGVGALLAPVYGWVMMRGLATWWRAATGTTLLEASTAGRPVMAGAAAAMALAGLVLWQSVRNWKAGRRARGEAGTERAWVAGLAGLGLLVAAMLLPALAAAGMADKGALMVGSGVALLGAGLCGAAWFARRAPLRLAAIPGRRALVRLALRNLSIAPRRTVAMLAVFSVPVFCLVSLEGFRRSAGAMRTGYDLYGESTVALALEPDAKTGAGLKWTSFRLEPGDDVSCLNLYRPVRPRVLGVPESFMKRSRLRFFASTGESAETRANPWLLLEAQLNSGVAPAIVDRASLQFVLRKRLGDEIEVERTGAAPLRLKIVATLDRSPLQSEILISEKNFLRLFPRSGGWNVFLMEGGARPDEVERALGGYGFRAMRADERLQGYLRVHNTHLSVFQTLGGLGLMLGGAAMAAMVMRARIRERRGHEALRRMGYGEGELRQVAMYETLAVGVYGLGLGVVSAMVGVAPEVGLNGVGLPALRALLMFAAPLCASVAAAWVGWGLMGTSGGGES